MGNDQSAIRQHALLQACEHGDIEKVHQVMDLGAEVEIEHVNWPGKTPLILATSNGHIEVVKALLNKYHADVVAKNDDGWTSLHYACWHGRLDIVKLLIEHEADVNSLTELEQTPLHFAARYNHLDIADYLIAIDADPNRRDSQGNKPFHDAVFEGHERMVTFLEDHTVQDDEEYVREQEELRMQQMDPSFAGTMLGSDGYGNNLYFVVNEESQENLMHVDGVGAPSEPGYSEMSGLIGIGAGGGQSTASFGVPANSKLAQIVVERNQEIGQLKQELRIQEEDKAQQQVRFKAELERTRQEYEEKISALQKRIQSLEKQVTTQEVVTRSYAAPTAVAGGLN